MQNAKHAHINLCVLEDAILPQELKNRIWHAASLEMKIFLIT